MIISLLMSNYYNPHRLTQDEINKQVDEAANGNPQRASNYRAKARDAVAFSNAVRKQLLQRLPPWQRNKQDEQAITQFEKLVSGNYDPNDLIAGMAYLDALGKRLLAM